MREARQALDWRNKLAGLDYGYIDGIVAATTKYPLTGINKDEIDTALGYFENNAPPHALPLVPPVRPVRRRGGSRIELQGTHRSKAQAVRHALDSSADAITALRCQQASRPENRIRPHVTTRHQPPDQPASKLPTGRLLK